MGLPPDRSRCRREMLEFAREELGPACEGRLLTAEIQARVMSRLRAGRDLADAVLGEVHALALGDREVADEFMAYFLFDVLAVGKRYLGPDLRRLLDTADLVQSVLGDVWPRVADLRFETRGQFLSLLAQRLRWKIADRRKGLRSDKRREDRRLDVDPQDLRLDAATASPLSKAALRESRERLQALLLRLSDRDRRLILLWLKGMSHEEIAVQLDLTVDTARRALSRAVQRARELTGSEG